MRLLLEDKRSILHNTLQLYNVKKKKDIPVLGNWVFNQSVDHLINAKK